MGQYNAQPKLMIATCVQYLDVLILIRTWHSYGMKEQCLHLFLFEFRFNSSVEIILLVFNLTDDIQLKVR